MLIKDKIYNNFGIISISLQFEYLGTMTHQQLINQQQLKMNLKTPTVTIDVMKKTILVEIPGVTEDDLNVMSID